MSEVVSELTDPILVFVLGCAGGGLAELAHWIKIRTSNNIPTYVRSALYWAITILMILAGGVLAFVYGEVGEINALLALNVGASAPLIIAGLANTPPKPPGALRSQSEKVREFLSWR